MASTSGGSEAGRALNGRYQLINVVGGGGMAQVYKARDNILGRVVAVKVLREQYASDAQFVARFKREAQAAANLAHPNIVNVYDVGQDGDCYYIVMEYIAGASLKEIITSSAPLPVGQAVNIAAQILAGLEYAHRSGLIHRDIKPQNVLITPEGGVKVTDFGIAKSVSDLGLTEAGLALGTAHYFSPEQARGERALPGSDIYAVGVTLYEMLTGRLPFESDNAMGLAYKHLSEPPRPPRELNPTIPPRVEAIVLKAMAKEPAERFSSAAEMEKALRAVLAGGQQATQEIPVARVKMAGAEKRGQRNAPPTSTLGTGMIAGAGGGGGTGGYPAVAGAGAGAGVGVATRRVVPSLAAPSSMAVRPAERGRSAGCSATAIAVAAVAVLAALLIAGVLLAPQIRGYFTNYVVPSPTSTPIIPTATPTNTPVPPSPTPTLTPTNTATPTATPVSVPVPQLVGLKIADAVTLAKQSGFNLVELDRIDTPEWPAGVVAQQDPPAKKIFKKTSTISVRVSRGPPPFKLPQLANTDMNAAKTTLEGTGLKVEVLNEGSNTVPEGVVIRTDPAADAEVRPGDTVKLVVSMGEVSVVPDLRLMENADIARQRLEAAGLTLGTITEAPDPTNSVPPGAVLSQDPARGSVVKKGTPVNIVIRKKE